jgi:hypothetical protein
MYKLEFVDTKNAYDELCKLPIHLIDNGEFEKRLRELFAKTKKLAKDGRNLEGIKLADSPEPAFEKWQEAYVNCKRITSEKFYLNPNVDWAKRKRSAKNWLSIIGLLVGIWGLLVTLGVFPPLR